MRKIWTHEMGLETIEDLEDLEHNATVVVAVLALGIDHPPTSIDQIDTVYCPTCGWLDPDDKHEADCQHDGLTF